jgi:ribosomal protein L37AE/L43A
MKKKRKRVRVRKPKPQPEDPQPCVDCGAGGVTRVDTYGIVSLDWRCRDCHEMACRRVYREAQKIRGP